MGEIHRNRGDSKKAKFHYEAAAMAGHEDARCKIGAMEYESWRHGGMGHQSGHLERAVKHLGIAASVGDHGAMHALRTFFEAGVVSRESIDSMLIAYNNSCTEMRSEARDTYIRVFIDPFGFSENNPT
jgi:TPR repeat protein